MGTMTPPEDPRRRLGRVMEERRAQLGLYVREVADAAGITAEGYRRVRDGSAPIRPTTKSGIERALRWAFGSMDAVLGGGEPTPLEAEPGRAGDKRPRYVQNVLRRMGEDPDYAQWVADLVETVQRGQPPDPKNVRGKDTA